MHGKAECCTRNDICMQHKRLCIDRPWPAPVQWDGLQCRWQWIGLKKHSSSLSALGSYNNRRQVSASSNRLSWEIEQISNCNLPFTYPPPNPPTNERSLLIRRSPWTNPVGGLGRGASRVFCGINFLRRVMQKKFIHLRCTTKHSTAPHKI